MKRKMVIAGALGVIGRAVLERFEDDPDVEVIGLSRSKPDFETAARHISVDLLKPDDCEAKLADALNGVTHAAFAAYTERLVLSEQVAPNLAMFENFLRTVDAHAPDLQHVTLFQGGKAYGCHLGQFRTPAKESDPRHMPPNFYYNQEDFLRSFAKGKRWRWTALRPEAVFGFAVGNPMNLLMVIAVYAAISKHLGVPMRFPGTLPAYDALYQITDADILASATDWAGRTEAAHGEIFNITNGDYFRWSTLWPFFADYFGMEYAAPIPLSLPDMMADKADVWNDIVRTHGLKPYKYEQIAAWLFGTYAFNNEFDNITSTIKARKFGFHDCIDTEEMFVQKFDRLREMKIIP